MRRNYFLLIGLVFFSLIGTSYGQTIEYGYDAAGNRVTRKPIVEVYKKAPGFSETTIQSDSTSQPAFEGEIGGLDFQVYPVPTAQYLNINVLGEPTSSVDVQLIDQQGRIILNRSNVSSTETLDLVSVSRGYYTLKILVGSEVSTWQIVKQ